MATNATTPVIRKHNSLLDLAGNSSIKIEHNGEDLYELIKVQHEHGYEPKNHPDILVRFFYNWGYTVGKYPCMTILVCTLVMAIFGSGSLMVESEPDFLEQFLDRDGEDYKNYKYLLDNFGVKGGITSSSYMFVKGKRDLLTPEGMQALTSLADQYSTGIGAKWEAVVDTYELNGEYESPVGISRLYESSNVPDNKAQILADLNTYPSAKTWNGEYVGDPLLYKYTQDANGNYETAKVCVLGVAYKSGITAFDKEAEDYEKALNDVVGTFPDIIEGVYVSNAYQANKDNTQLNAQMTFGVVVASILICIYCLTTMRIGQVHGRSEMMIASLISVGFAAITAYGLIGYLGVTWNTMNSMAIILMIGISFDDCFILTWDYHQQYLWGLHLVEENKGKTISEVYPIEERIGNTMAAGGYSVFITSFTDLIIFSIAAAMSPIPMLKSFSLFCGIGVFLDFLFQTTIFLALLHFSAKRQETGRMDCCCCCSPPKDINARDCGKEPLNPFMNNSIYDKFFGQHLPNCVLSRIGMFVVLLLWLVFLVIGIIGMTNVETEWDTTAFNLEGTDGYEISKIQSEEPASKSPNTIFFKSDDFARFKNNTDMVLLGLQSDPVHFVATSCVWFDYNAWLDNNTMQFPSTHTLFSKTMNDFINSTAGFSLSDDVVFEDEEQTDVKSFQGTTFEAGAFEYKVMLNNYREMKKVVESQNEEGFEGFRFGIWGALNEMNEDQLPNCLRQLYVAVPVIALIVAANLRHLQATLYVFIMIVSIDIELIGMSAFAGIKFDFFFALAILLALGVTVDFNIHVAHRSLELLEDDSIENAYERNVDHTRKVYMSVGSSVFHGTFSTLLVCLVPIFFIGIKAFRQFFGMLCLIMVFGMFHGLVVLPVIMTIFPITHSHTARAVTIRRNTQMGEDLIGVKISDSEENDDKRSPQDKVEMQPKA